MIYHLEEKSFGNLCFPGKHETRDLGSSFKSGPNASLATQFNNGVTAVAANDNDDRGVLRETQMGLRRDPRVVRKMRNQFRERVSLRESTTDSDPL